MRFRMNKSLFFYVGACLALAGCSTTQLTGVNPQSVIDKVWVLTSMNGVRSLGPRVTMELMPTSYQDGRIGGQSQCNSYYGRYQIANNKISFTPMGGSRSVCPPPYMTKEAEYLAAFPELNDIIIYGNHLTLSSRNGKQKLVYSAESASISGQVSAIDGKFPAGSEVIVILQNKAMPDNPVGIIGVETILVSQATDVVNYQVSYTPETVNPDADYELIAEVMENGELIYATTAKPSVQLESAPATSQ